MNIKDILKSIGAVLAGFLVVAVLSTIVDYILEVAGVLPSVVNPIPFASWMYVLALVYRTIFTIVGGYVAAYLAPNHAMRHVWVLAIFGFFMGAIGTIVNWNLAQGYEWYPIILALLAIPSVVYGGYLKTGKYN